MTRQGEGVCLCSERGCIARPTVEGVFMASEDTGQHMRGQGVQRGQCWGVRKGLGAAVGRAGAKGCKSVRLPWGRDGGGGGVAGGTSAPGWLRGSTWGCLVAGPSRSGLRQPWARPAQPRRPQPTRKSPGS